MIVSNVKNLISSMWQYLLYIIIWCGFLGAYDWLTVTSGVFLVFFISILFGLSRQKINIYRLCLLIGYVLYRLVESSFYVLVEIFKRANVDKYVIKKVNFSKLTSTQKVVLANLISLTPGTLTIDVSNNSVTIHDMFSFKEGCVSDDIVDKLIPKIVKAFPC